ncbi:UNVERIFIED_CONTAM: hypothetical protein FKN15_022332 [Acipenser sinensis]
MLSMSNNNSMSYNDQGGAAEPATEAGLETTPTTSAGAGFGLFSTDYKKNDDLKAMLESSKDSSKLEAMKRIVGLIAKGKNASELFPAVVKNVASKNIEDPNQLIRASALRVLSSIRVPIIVPIMMLAIKEAATDLSPYVRKTAAHAIQKLYSLDPDQKEHLIEVIEKLLKDKSTLKKLVYVYLVRYAEEQQDVALLSISTFQRALKDPNQLIRASALRVLSSIRVPIIVPIMMLAIKEAATDLSPYVRKTAAHAIQKLYSDINKKQYKLVAGSVVMAFEEVCPDRIDLIHKNYRKLCNMLVDVEEWGQVLIINMLTRYARTQFLDPWKQVVMAVAQLYWHLAPKSEVSLVTKSLVRLLRSHREVQFIVLQNIATMSIQRKGMFEPYLKSFYVRSTDPTHIKTLKLEILTNLANGANISTVLREFQVPMARASILWLIGEYCERVPKIAPDVLRKMAKAFTCEEEIVKLQTLNLAAKLYLTNAKQICDLRSAFHLLLGNRAEFQLKCFSMLHCEANSAMHLLYLPHCSVVL